MPSSPMPPRPPFPLWGWSAGPELPKAPKVLGVLSIIFGSIISAESLYGVVAGSSGSRFLPTLSPAGQDALARYMADIRVGAMLTSILFLAMSVSLVAIGVGQLKYRRFAVRASTGWSLIGFAVLAVVFALQMTVLGPAQDRLMEAVSRETGAPNVLGSLGTMTALLTLVFYLPYPIVLLVTFRKPHIVAAMRT